MKKNYFPWPCCLQWAPQRHPASTSPSLPPQTTAAPCTAQPAQGCSVSSVSCRGHSAPAARQRVALGGQEGDSPSEKPRQQQCGHAEAAF